jgi:hypothetical protein
MRTWVLVALTLLSTSCSFPDYVFESSTISNASCAAHPCQNDGTCVALDDGDYACLCSPGFAGQNCERYADACESAPCLNGGTCREDLGSFTCDCLPGFSGRYCEINLDDCSPNPCQNGGVCFDGVADYTCDCPPAFSGRHCEINLDDCSPNPCQNGGVCFDGDATYVCACPPGFTGDTCSGETHRTCSELLEATPDARSGVYAVDPDGPGVGRSPVSVFCDMTPSDAGWMLVGREAAGSQGTFRFLAEEEGLASQIAEGTGNGLIAARFAGLYTEVRLRWYGPKDGFIGFRPERELFANEVDTAIPVSNFSTSENQLETWVNEAGGAIFCRASQSLDVRPGDTSWAVKPLNDMNVMCGCNSGGWLGRGAFYGGNLNPTSCFGFGGGWSSVRSDHEPKGGILEYELELWIR